MDIAVIIVNWQRPQDTIECVLSVQKSQARGLKIIVIDNGSQDDSIQLLREALSDIELVALPNNLGFSGGYNAGIQHALDSPVDYLFLLNNDTTIKPDTISELLASPWDMAVPKILYYDDPKRIWSAGSKWRWLPPSVKMIGYQKLDGPPYQIAKPLEYATGCALMVSRELLENIGGFDPAFENYMEDYDFAFRVRRAGFKIGYIPEAIIYHKVSRSLGAGSPQVWHYMGRNSVLFYRVGNRFPLWMLASFISWVTIREVIRGNWKILPAYWRGIRAGVSVLKKDI